MVQIPLLPQQWSQEDRSEQIELSEGGLRVDYTGNFPREPSSVRTDRPIPSECGLYYFEVNIVSAGRDGYIGIGLSSANADLRSLPGWNATSYGYHADDGHSFSSSGTGKPYGPTYTTGDVIGCGVNFFDGSCFFTKNGQNLGVAFRDLPGGLYPTVGLLTPGGIVETNFGMQSFMFDMRVLS